MFPWEQLLHVQEGGAGAPEVGYTSTPSSETKLPSRSNASSTSSLSARGSSGIPTSNACEPHSLQSAMSGRPVDGSGERLNGTASLRVQEHRGLGVQEHRGNIPR